MTRHPIRRCLPALLLLGALLLAPGAAAQTTVLDVKDSASTTLMQVNDDGGLLSLGTFGTGTIPASGAGTRLMWHPRNAAFRAGSVTGFQWDPIFTGDYSVALGQNTRASGVASTALGISTVASGSATTAMGNDTEASGSSATAMGRSTIASNAYSTAMGDGTEASGNAATAMGDLTTASGTAATAMGFSTTASGGASSAMGNVTAASGFASTAMGNNTTAQAYASLVLGRYNIVAGNATSWVSSDPVLVVGNGSTSSSRSNALTLRKNGDLEIAGTLTENSDRRLKRDLQPLSAASSALGRLQPVRYRFREGINRPEGMQIGLVAQEVETVFPELVSQGADGYLSVSYTHLVAVLVQALNEQQDEIEALHHRLAHLEAALLQAGSAPETTSAER